MQSQTALPAAKLRNLRHYCPDAEAAGMQHLGDIIANLIEKYDTVIGPKEFKEKFEEALKTWDPEDYALRENGNVIPMERLFCLEILLYAIFPKDFADNVNREYGRQK